MRVDIEIRGGISGGDMKGAMDKAIFATSEQALKDCNYFCKQDSGDLIKSSVIHSDFNNGELKWTMPYAEKQYKLPSAKGLKALMAPSGRLFSSGRMRRR